MIYLCIYSDALPFSSTISRETCPSLPHEAIAAGWRKAKNYQGEWHVKNCELKWFLPQEACDLLGNLGKIVFNGDSLIHQLLIGLGAVLSGNYRTGGISKSVPKDYLEGCQCERLYHCKINNQHQQNLGALRFGDAVGGDPAKYKSPQFDLCPRWTRDHVIWVRIKCRKILSTPVQSSLVPS